MNNINLAAGKDFKFGRVQGRSLAVGGAIAVAALLCPNGASAQAPQLVSVTPAEGATGVSPTTTIVFEFDRPMDTGIEVISGFSFMGFGFVGNLDLKPAVDSPLFMGTWSDDERTLTCEAPSGELPTGTLVTWTLNPPGISAGYAEPIVSLEGTELATVSGSFTTSGQGGGGGGGDEDCDGVPDAWGGYSIFKGISYEQTSAADPVPAAESPYTFGVLVNSPDAGPDVTEGSVTRPDGATQSLSGGFGGGLFFFTSPAFEADLESAFPAGTYTLRFTQTGEPEQVIPMDLPVNNIPIPKIANYVEAQAINAAQDFTLRWNEFTGAGSDDYLSITVEDDTSSAGIVFQAPDYCVPRELAVNATSVVIPANTLLSDRIYQGTLTFGKPGYLSTNDVPEMQGSAAVSRMTSFTLNTGSGGAGPGIPATLAEVQVRPNGNPEMSLSGTALRDYTVERTESLNPPNWVSVGTVTMDVGGQGVFEDTTASGAFPLFYRAVTY